MPQQTATVKSHRKFSFLDSFSVGHAGRIEQEKDVKYLEEDYSAALKLAANLSSHVKWIPYPFLVNRLRKVADDVRSQAEVMRTKIVELGGTVPQVNIESREDVEFRENVKRLVRDMEEYSSRSEALVHQRNNIRDAGVLKLVETIASEMQSQKDELMDIVMRLS
jgi:predicted translin family RNA/ssDNA-binding protein